MTSKSGDPVCLLCDGTGWINTTAGRVKRCNCFRRKKYDLLLKKSGIPERYKACRLNNFNIYIEEKGKKKANTAISQPLEFAKDFIRSFPLISKGILFTGQCGVGKTHLAVAMLMEVLANKKGTVKFYDWRDLMKTIQACYGTDRIKTEQEVLLPIFDCDVLCLDELGAKKVSEFFLDMLTVIINKRYNEKKTTIITSNWIDKPKRAKEESLTDRIGYNLRSRLYEMCHVFELSGEDYRLREENKLELVDK